MTSYSHLTHLALTVRNLYLSLPWHNALPEQARCPPGRRISSGLPPPTPVCVDPIESLTRRDRRAWRRAERHVVAQHQNAVAIRLCHLATRRLPVQTTSVLAERSAIVGLTLPGWRIFLTGVAVQPRISLLAAAESQRLQLLGGGRYGRFWWLCVGDSRGERVVLLGSHLRLSAVGKESETENTPSPPGQLVGALPTYTGR